MIRYGFFYFENWKISKKNVSRPGEPCLKFSMEILYQWVKTTKLFDKQKHDKWAGSQVLAFDFINFRKTNDYKYYSSIIIVILTKVLNKITKHFRQMFDIPK